MVETGMGGVIDWEQYIGDGDCGQYLGGVSIFREVEIGTTGGI